MPRANDGNPQKFFAGNFNIRITFIVTQVNIVIRLVFLDERRLQDQGLGLTVGDDIIDAPDVTDQPSGFGITLGLAEIRRHALAQTDSLADVDHVAGSVFHQVHAAGCGEGFDQGNERHRKSWRVGELAGYLLPVDGYVLPVSSCRLPVKSPVCLDQCFYPEAAWLLKLFVYFWEVFLSINHPNNTPVRAQNIIVKI